MVKFPGMNSRGSYSHLSPEGMGQKQFPEPREWSGVGGAHWTGAVIEEEGCSHWCHRSSREEGGDNSPDSASPSIDLTELEPQCEKALLI